MNKKVLVAGGAGYIGSHTAVELINAGYEVVIVDNFSNSDASSLEGIQKITGVTPTFVEADCCDKEAMRRIFEAYDFDSAIHFAAFKAVGESVGQPLKYYRNNLISLVNILELMKEYGRKNVVFSSSATVYGDADVLPVTELTPRKPATSPYGNTKQMSEDILRDMVAATESFSGIALRYFNPIGAHPSALIGELPRGVPNNLVPYTNERMYDILFDIREQRQELQFQDGMFFNGLPDMSIRVAHQDEKSKELSDVLIFDTRNANGDMTTTVAESGHIRMSDDKGYLYVTLNNGRTYEHTRNSQWYDKNSIRIHEFTRQDATIPIDKVGRPDGDMSREFSESNTRDMSGLEELMDSLQLQIEHYNVVSLTPTVKRQIFVRDTTIFPDDSLHIDRTAFKPINFYDSISNLSLRQRAKVYQAAYNQSRSAQGSYSYDEQASKIPLTQYYPSLNEWHRKLTLPVSIIIFFMIYN